MSRAFVKEPDGEVAEDLPDRLISEHPNFVTAKGLTQIDDEIARLRPALAEAQAKGEKQAVATASRDLRYWTARRSSAELIEAPSSKEIRFGSTVVIARGNGRKQTFRITGEDEADPSRGTLSYVAPLARALIGKTKGDEIAFMDDDIAILAVT